MTDRVTRSRTGYWFWLAAAVVAILITANSVLVLRQLEFMRQTSRERAFWSLCHAGTTPEQRTHHFLQLVADGNQHWKGALLTDLTLKDVDLSGVNLESALFADCRMSGINLQSTNLTAASLDTSDLTDANCQSAHLRDATLFKSTLTNANFRSADLLSTSFEQVSAVGANFVSAKLGDGFLPMADLTGADFTGADMTGATLEGAILRDAELALTNLFEADLTDADLTNANWWRSRGLSTSQLLELSKSSPPDATASESRQRDYALWISRQPGSAAHAEEP